LRLNPGKLRFTRNAQRLGGVVERRGAVTVFWTHRPAAQTRAALETCAFR
jgi:hypothetical protein